MSDSIRIDVIETIESVGVTVTEQNQTAVNINEGTTWGKIIGTLSNQTDLQAALDAKQNSLGYTAENASNKVTAFQVTPDNTHYPSEKLVKDSLDAKSASDHNHSLNNLTEKSYNSLTDKPTIPTALFQLNDDSEHRLVTDTEKSIWNGKQNALGFTPENVSNKLTSFQITPDDTHYPTEKLIKDNLDLKVDKVSGKGLSTNDLTDALKANYDAAYAVTGNTTKIKLTAEGGVAIKLTNRTGGVSVKGYCITTDTVNDNAVKLVPIDSPNCIGVFYDNGVPDGAEAWVVVSGIADVYFWGSTTRGYLARTGLSTDTGEISGQALSEAVPTSPFATDKHFCEIGHLLETRSGAGLAKVVLHFN